MTTRQRPTSEEVLKGMKALHEMGLGMVKSPTKTQTVYYKPTPYDSNRDVLLPAIESDQWDTYVQHFQELDTTYMTATQHNRFLLEADDQDCLLYTSPSPRDATLSRMPSSA